MKPELLKKINTSLVVIVSLLFILSGVAKLFPIQAFELLLISEGLFTWDNVQLFSRGLISIELIIGVGLLLPYKHRSFFYSAALFVLAVFSLQLVFSIVRGNTENCGCFGTLFPMSPLSALVKNIIAVGIVSYLKYRTEPIERKMPLAIMSFALVIPIMIISMFPFVEPPVISPAQPPLQSEVVEMPQKSLDQYLKEKKEPEFNQPDTSVTANLKNEKKQLSPQEKLLQRFAPTSSVFAGFTELDSGEKFNPDSGIRVFAVLSLDCEHCKEAAMHFKELKKLGVLPYKTVFVLLGDKSQFAWFFGSENADFPYVIVGPEQFFPLLSAAPPRIVLLVNGNVVKSLEGDAVSRQGIRNLFEVQR